MERSLSSGNQTSCPLRTEIFTDEQLQTLHQTTLDVLQDVGVKVESEEAINIFSSAGAEVTRSGAYGIVKISSDIIEKCIHSAPSRVTYHGRDAKYDFIAESNKVGFSTFGECVQIIDPITRRLRSTTKEDLGKITRVCDRLDEIVMVERPVGSVEQFAATQALHNYEAMVTNTGKHIFLGFYSGENTKRIARMAAACVGGDENFKKRTPVTTFVCPTSPLVLVKMCCDVIIQSARLGIGVAPISMVLAGATSPVTLAGSIVLHNAEILSAIVLAQLTSPGIPCTYAGMSTVIDLRTAVPVTGSPEHGLISAGLTQLAKMYKLPCWVGGGVSDSKLPDTQAAYDFSLPAILAALSGPNFIYGAGALESGLTFDYAKLIMDCEQIGRIQHMLKGVPVNRNTLALDVIKEVGPGGEFLTHSHTFDNMRAISRSDLFDRRSRPSWMNKTGGKDLTERAYERALEIISNHEPPPLPKSAADIMRNIVDTYETKLKLH